MKAYKILFFSFLLLLNLSYSQVSNDILPVELIYFEAHLTYSGILLRWGTATEVNNFGFEIQRADSSLQFVGIDFVPGNGTSNSPKHYFYIDSSLTEFGIYYYRLKQIDIDGQFGFSDTVSILYQPSSAEKISSETQVKVIVTNDINSKELLIKFGENTNADISLIIYSILGEKILEKKIPLNHSYQIINYSSLPSGVYLLTLNSSKGLLTTYKFIAIH